MISPHPYQHMVNLEAKGKKKRDLKNSNKNDPLIGTPFLYFPHELFFLIFVLISAVAMD